jgi:ribosomal protein L37AE/L43A
MIACPNCGNLVTFNTYFGAFICNRCKWKNDNYNLDRISGTSVLKTMAEYIDEATGDKKRKKEGDNP